MARFRSHWACKDCLNPEEKPAAAQAPDPGSLKILNLYSGIGGNRYLWPESVNVTAVEFNPKIAAVYKKMFPNDTVIVGDAHAYLLKNYYRFDVIWTSRPCQSHSRMNYLFGDNRRKYADLALYQEILLLREFFKGKYVAENVDPYYGALIPFNFKIHRHVFWTNVPLNSNVSLPAIGGVGLIKNRDAAGFEVLKKWLGIDLQEKLYSTSKDCCQVLRNCVHPVLGKSIFDDIINSI